MYRQRHSWHLHMQTGTGGRMGTLGRHAPPFVGRSQGMHLAAPVDGLWDASRGGLLAYYPARRRQDRTDEDHEMEGWQSRAEPWRCCGRERRIRWPMGWDER
ncbi:hypothetical protein VTL71DRAFT_10772 [Oculimacula yallundae]|uniref:Uncharacterized protein n=1 Tax=Oculimacula yallundae TaxID=86028 RepID=A0ABR4CVR2_9HELO